MNDNYANIYLFSTQKYAKKYLLYPKIYFIEVNTYFLRICHRNPVFTPIGFQCTPFHLRRDYESKVIKYKFSKWGRYVEG